MEDSPRLVEGSPQLEAGTHQLGEGNPRLGEGTFQAAEGSRRPVVDIQGSSLLRKAREGRLNN